LATARPSGGAWGRPNGPKVDSGPALSGRGRQRWPPWQTAKKVPNQKQGAAEPAPREGWPVVWDPGRWALGSGGGYAAQFAADVGLKTPQIGGEFGKVRLVRRFQQGHAPPF